MKNLRDKLRRISLSIQSETITNVLVVVGILASWQMFWSMLDILFHINTPLISSIVAIAIGMFLLHAPTSTLARLSNYTEIKK